MKKLQLIRQIIEFSMTVFLLCFFVQSCCLCCVERVPSDDNRAHDSSISYHHHGLSGHSTCNPFVPGWGSGGGLVWPTTMSCSMKTCFLWWIYIYFFDSTFIIPESFWFSSLDREKVMSCLVNGLSSQPLIDRNTLLHVFETFVCFWSFFCVIRSFLPSKFTALPPWSLRFSFFLFSNWIRVF